MLENLPMKRRSKLSVAVPASLVSDVPHLREKTFKIGLIGRALAIFRIDEVVIFHDRPDKDQSREINLIASVLSYMETPQYLRKNLFKISPELRYAGVLPPLRTPHHPLKNRKKELKVGEFREGAVVEASSRGTFVEIGVEEPVLIPDVQVQANMRVTVKILEGGEHPKATMTNPDDIKVYWGYMVTASKAPFGRMVREKPFDLVIATSRRGEPFTKVVNDVLRVWEKSKNVLVAFGSPTQGLHEIVRQENLKLSDVADFVVNTIPNQATETVRTEEALYATLAALNLLAKEQNVRSR